MSISAKDLQLILQEVLQKQEERYEKQEERYEKLLSTLLSKSDVSPPAAATKERTAEQIMESLSHSITEFIYDPEDGVTFEAWYKRYEDLFKVDAAKLDDTARVRLLLRKLHTSVHDRYTNFILPKNSRDFTFEATVAELTKLFGTRTSLFNTRYQCLKLVKNPNDDFFTHAGIVNRECEKFQLGTLTSDQFKCLVFACSLQSSGDMEIRKQILNKIETDADITLQRLAEECKRLVNLKHDAKMIEQAGSSSTIVKVNAVNSFKPKKGQPSTVHQSINSQHHQRILSLLYRLHLVGSVVLLTSSVTVHSHNTHAVTVITKDTRKDFANFAIHSARPLKIVTSTSQRKENRIPA